MQERIHNFSAGPAALPEAVLQRAQEEMLSWQGRGLSVMEISHRHHSFMDLAQQAETHLRQLMNIPDNYRVIFMQGGATAQFSILPLNLLGDKHQADFIETGIWSTKASKAFVPYGQVNIVGAAKQTEAGLWYVPAESTLQFSQDSAYVHYCPNETISGLAFDYIPATDAVPLVADMSSMILSRPVDVSRFGVIYAGAQKNIGPAGITVIIVREDLLDQAQPDTPSVFNYTLQNQQGSMVNTPPTYTWYLAALVFEWLLQQGGVEAMANINQQKAKYLYTAIDQSDFYANPILPANRSIMNVSFQLADDSLNSEFVKQAEAHHLWHLKGHRQLGGMRASIYNAVSMDSVKALVDFMQIFEQRYG